MPITSVDKDFDSLTLSLTAEFEASREEVWNLWADPRKLERWWGPPSHPATFEKHDLSQGGEVAYFMTGPEGDKHHGWWRIESVDAPRALEFTDGFADADGKPTEGAPLTKVRMELSEAGGTTTMILRSAFASREQMNEMIEMGAAEGLQEAISQMDALLAE